MNYQEDATLVGPRPKLDGSGPFPLARAVDWARSVPGWMSARELAFLAGRAASLPPAGTWVEVGLWMGRSFSAVALAAPDGCRAVAVDHFLGSPEERETAHAGAASSESIFRRTLQALRHARPGVALDCMAQPSTEAARAFPDASLDAVFIDAGHDYLSIKADLAAWKPKLKPGGTLMGHDGNNEPIRQALAETLPEFCLAVDSIWTWKNPRPRQQCAILTPVYATPERRTEDALLELSRRGYAVRYLIGCSDIVLARSVMASDALKDGFRETMWIDSDIDFDPDDVDRLRAHDLPYVCGLYMRKGVGQFAGTFFDGPDITFGQGGGLLPIKYAGIGFTYIRAEVYEAIARIRDLHECARGPDGRTFTPYFLPATVHEGAEWDYLGEDNAFCHFAREAGFPPMADTTIRLGHIGKYTWTWDDLAPRQQFASLTMNVGPCPAPLAVPTWTAEVEQSPLPGDDDVNEIDRLKQKIALVEQEQREVEKNWQRCDGALSVLRHMLGEALRAEDEASAKSDTREVPEPCVARMNGELPASAGE